MPALSVEELKGMYPLIFARHARALIVGGKTQDEADVMTAGIMNAMSRNLEVVERWKKTGEEVVVGTHHTGDQKETNSGSQKGNQKVTRKNNSKITGSARKNTLRWEVEE